MRSPVADIGDSLLLPLPLVLPYSDGDESRHEGGASRDEGGEVIVLGVTGRVGVPVALVDLDDDTGMHDAISSSVK